MNRLGIISQPRKMELVDVDAERSYPRPRENAAALPAELLDVAASDAGRGVSLRAEDQLIPIIYVLQQAARLR